LHLRDTDARVANVDAHVLARPAAANENPAFGVGIFDSVIDQIPEDAIEKHRIAHDGRVSRAHTDLDPLLQCAFLIFVACLPKQRFERDGRELQLLGMLIEANSPQQLIKLAAEAIDCVLTRLQQILFGFGPNADAEKVVGVLDDLQWLPKIMTGHSEEHGLKVGGPLWVCPTCRSQGYWLLGPPRDADAAGVADNRKPFVCVGHDVLSSS
jgi:hypothetical protein